MKKVLKELSFEIIQKCPNNCLYCSSNSSKNCNHMIEYDIFKNVVDDAISLGMNRLCISGGEPFLHPQLQEMIAYAKKYNNVEVFVYTSGVSEDVNGNAIPLDYEILQEIKRVKVDRVIFNLQSADEGIYNSIMQTVNYFSIAKESILRTTNTGIYTEIHFVPMKINYKGVSQVIELANELNVNQISFLRLVLQGRAYKNRNLVEMREEELAIFKHILSTQVKNLESIRVRMGIPLSKKEEGKKCNAGFGKLIIRYDGAVFPCEAYKYIESINRGNKVRPDNIREKALVDIWHNSNFLNVLRADIEKFKSDDITCEVCPAQWNINMYRQNIV